ncbi:MAG TPA: thioesterase family protein [Solirubrobacteraceae bacterium]
MGATEFDRATAVAALGAGAYSADSSPDWSAPRGPNGGYLAAIVLRAMRAELADRARPARSLTLHYLRPPGDGELRIDVAIERGGRRLSSLSARVSQDGRLCVLALAAFSAGFDRTVSFGARMPDAPPWESIEPYPPFPEMPAIARRIEMRPAVGAPPFSGAAEALTGGWLRLREPRPLDEVALALYADAWLPALFPALPGAVGVPTIDLTVHFRAPEVAATADPNAPVLGVFRSTDAAEGFIEEDGELWSPDGVLLTQSRQLALLLPAGDDA